MLFRSTDNIVPVFPCRDKANDGDLAGNVLCQPGGSLIRFWISTAAKSGSAEISKVTVAEKPPACVSSCRSFITATSTAVCPLPSVVFVVLVSPIKAHKKGACVKHPAKNLPVTGGTGGRTLLYRTNVVKFGENEAKFLGFGFFAYLCPASRGISSVGQSACMACKRSPVRPWYSPLH